MFIFGYYESPFDSRDLSAEEFVKVSSLPIQYSLDGGEVLDQGNTPMCSAVTAVCNMEWKTTLTGGKRINLSERFVYDHRTQKDLDGMTPRDTMKILHKIGVCPQSAYKKSNAEEAAQEHRITGYARIHTIDCMKSALIANGPVYIGLPVRSYDSKFWLGGAILGGHAVPVVGYDENSFLIKNSWGTAWGDNGYTSLPFSEFSQIIEAWTMW